MECVYIFNDITIKSIVNLFDYHILISLSISTKKYSYFFFMKKHYIFSSTISSDKLQTLYTFTDMKHAENVDLRKNNEVNNLKSFCNLDTLSLSRHSSVSDVSHLSKLIHLEMGYRISNVDGLTNLRSLIVHGKTSNMSEINNSLIVYLKIYLKHRCCCTKLTNLEKLEVCKPFDNNFTLDIESTKLTNLRIQYKYKNNVFPSLFTPNNMTKFMTLKVLCVECKYPGDLINLEKIHLINISDSFTVKKLTNLTKLIVSNCPRLILETNDFTNLRSLQIIKNQKSSHIVLPISTQINSLRNLRKLIINDTIYFNHLGNLNQLTYLKLLTSSLGTLKGLSELKYLHMNCTSNYLLGNISYCGSLKNIYLSDSSNARLLCVVNDVNYYY